MSELFPRIFTNEFPCIRSTNVVENTDKCSPIAEINAFIHSSLYAQGKIKSGVVVVVYCRPPVEGPIVPVFSRSCCIVDPKSCPVTDILPPSSPWSPTNSALQSLNSLLSSLYVHSSSASIFLCELTVTSPLLALIVPIRLFCDLSTKLSILFGSTTSQKLQSVSLLPCEWSIPHFHM